MASSKSPATWLSYLKVRQLQRLASLTGTLSSGTKSALIGRLDETLRVEPGSSSTGLTKAHHISQDASREDLSIDNNKTASILSIDMGIRNLAFAHLIIPPGQAGRTPSGEFKPPVLKAWYRLAVPSFLSNSTAGNQVLDLNLGEEMRPKEKKIAKGHKQKTSDEPEEASVGQKKGKKEEKEKVKESFAPKLYAAHAYTLMSSLLATYNPTHILIERQRFRSGGGSAVQEWTIRVGVFEGMLYAVLRAIQQERKGEMTNIAVQGVEPQRVMRYWMDDEKVPDSRSKPRTSSKRVSKKITPNLRKQIKIDRIGTLLSSRTGSNMESTSSSDLGDHLGIQLGDDKHLHEVVKAYMRKWEKKPKGKKPSTGSSVSPSSKKTSRSTTVDLEDQTLEIDKLDDLADCLLQGMTWLEWQNTRQEIARRGLEAISSKIGN
ncbi:hypothetical protein AJ79_07272 [Helicocarpus griseus UAMH5409]|uniref:SAP domain-containing protein n=1 Tax=Helicocarpus griseus UAMH5409 TaxID=1447875 RepID=A0A2B7X411_9EURO|nr:hypothetical protein AJ79_07272 [Helicocarpus griseus UAMH5409]